MLIELLRYSSQKDDTLGVMLIDGRFACYTLEDEFRTQKVYGETRIPAGQYEIGFRREGGFHSRYERLFGEMHAGMLELKNVPNFEHILIHCGNRDDDTAGCILVGNNAQQNVTEDGFIGNSRDAYRRVYPEIARSLKANWRVHIVIRDYA